MVTYQYKATQERKNMNHVEHLFIENSDWSVHWAELVHCPFWLPDRTKKARVVKSYES